MIYRHFRVTAKGGQGDELAEALSSLASVVRTIPGCHAIKLYRTEASAGEFFLIEEWDSIDSHKKAGSHVPQSVLKVIAAAVESSDGGFTELVDAG